MGDRQRRRTARLPFLGRAPTGTGLRKSCRRSGRAVGDPSYAEIVRRISDQRVAQGIPTHGARVARTTVYDTFRTERSRVNLAFVREIAHALGGEDAQVDEWIARCRDSSPATR